MYAYRHLGVWKHGDVLSVRFGEHRILDEATVRMLGDELYAVADRPDCHHLLLNFASVVALSSLMVGKLLMLQRKMVSKGGKLKLCELGPRTARPRRRHQARPDLRHLGRRAGCPAGLLVRLGRKGARGQRASLIAA